MSVSSTPRRRGLVVILPFLLLAAGARPAAAGLRFRQVPGPSGADALCLLGDGATLWAGTPHGVWRLSGGAWDLDGLPGASVSSLAVADGSLWAAAGDDGLFRRGADGTWSAAAFPQSPVLTLLADGNTLYAAGFSPFVRTAGSSTWTPLAAPGGVVVSLALFSGDLVAGLGNGGAVRYSGGAVVPLAAGIGVGEPVRAMAVLNGVLWAGTTKALYWWNGAAWTSDVAFGSHEVLGLGGMAGALFAATSDAGVLRKSLAGWSPLNQGLPFPSATSFALLGSDLYVGTAGGPVSRLLGAQWVAAGTDLFATTVPDAFVSDPLIPTSLIATRGAGLVEATAGSFHNVLPDGCGDVTAAVPAPPAGSGAVLAATNCGPFLGSSGVFNPAISGLPLGVTPGTLASASSRDVFGGTASAGIWRFDGAFWSDDNAGLSSTASVGAIRQVGNDLLAATGLGVARRGSGGEWDDASTGLPFGASVLAFGGPGAPAGPVFAGLQTGGVYRLDAGATVWRKDAAGVATSAVLSIDLSSARLFAAAGPAGFLRKRAGGWLSESAGLPAGVDALLVRNAVRAPGQGRDYLFAGSSGNGLFAAESAPAVATIPVVLDVTGGTGARFRTELTLGNRSAQASLTARLTFTAAPLFGAPARGSADVILPPGTEIRAPDALSYLRSLGMAIPDSTPSAPVSGSLSAQEVSAVATDSLYAFARSYTAGSAGGTYGVFLDATSDLDAAEETAYVYGLRSISGVARSNLAVTYVPAPDRGGDPIALEVQVYDAAGRAAPTLLTRTLAPGEWFQWNGLLEKAGLPDGSFGYARVRRVSGIGPFIAYGVVNDAVTSDGSVLPMYRPGGLASARKLVVPVVLDVYGEAGSHFTTELTLANDGILPTPVDLVYRPAPGFGTATGAPVVTLSLAARAQTTIPDVIQYLRDHGVGIPDPLTAGAQAGTLSVEFRSLASFDASRTVALARTSTPGTSGGSFGVFYPAFAAGGGARTSALVPGLVRSAAARSNLAVVHAGGGSLLPVTLSVQLHDAATGAAAGNPLTVTLNAGDWFQWSRVFDKAGVPPGTTQVYAVVTRISGDDTFLAYGVVNDAVTSDGSFIAMLPAEEY